MTTDNESIVEQLTARPTTAFVPKSNNARMGISLEEQRDIFVDALDVGAMLVKSVQTGEVKTLNIDTNTVLKNPVTLDAFEVRDTKVVRKHKLRS